MAFWDNDPVASLGDTAQLTAYGQRRALEQGDPEVLLAAYGQRRVQQQDQPPPDFSQDPAAPPLTWGQVGSGAARNFIPSAVQFGRDIVQPVLHPIDTATNLYDVGAGLMEKASIVSGDEHKKYADAVGQYFADRYGGVENIKRAIANDPVGVMGDLSAFFSSGGSALARAPGILGRAGEIAGTAGRIIDPLTNAGRLGGAVAKGGGFLAREGLGLTTGVGPEVIRGAYEAGKQGGQAADIFRENIKGLADPTEAVTDARSAVEQLRQERGNEYRQQLAQLKQNPTIMHWNDVDRALDEMDKIATFRGRSGTGPMKKLSESTDAIREAIKDKVAEWKNERASEYWTPEGFDALKRSIADIPNKTNAPYGSPARLTADKMVNAIKETIIRQDPAYAKMMGGYEQASNILREIEGTLSTDRRARIDTSLRKLQTVLRNNVSSNYGYRGKLLEFLQNAGAPNLMTRLSGQALNTWSPRGLNRAIAGAFPFGVGGASALMGGGLVGSIGAAAAAVPGLVLSSPRAMGEAAYALGAGRRYAGQAGHYLPLRQLAEPSRQIGRQDPRQQAIRIRPLSE